MIKLENMFTGQVYKIVNNVNDKIYVGSTKYSLDNRFTRHKSAYKSYKKNEITTCPKKLFGGFEKIGVDKFKIELIKKYKYATKGELRIHEDYFIRLYDTINNGYNMEYAVAEVVIYRCKPCDFKCKFPSAWKEHIEADRHIKKIEEKEFEEKYGYSRNRYCEICNKTFTIKKDYKRHLTRDKHINKVKELEDLKNGKPPKNEFRCEICNVGFPYKSGIDRHNKKPTHIKKVEIKKLGYNPDKYCKKCKREFAQPKQFRRHMKKEHDIIITKK